MSRNLVVRRESKRYPGLFVKKYDRKVFYDGLWTPELMECRGHVEDRSGNIVIRPFTKIFNRFERKTDIPRDEWVTAIQKINGFMAAVTYIPELEKSVVSTIESLDSDFVTMAEEKLNPLVFEISDRFHLKPTTFLFEIVHENDPHVVPEVPGAYLIGMREVSDESPYMSDRALERRLDIVADKMGVHRPDWEEGQFGDIVERARVCQHEGFVIYGKKTALKIKSPFYLTTKFLGRLSKNKMETLANDPLSLKKDLDEEFYPLLETIARTPDFVTMDEQNRMAFIRDFLKGLQQ